MSHILIISNTVELLRLYATDVVCIEADGNYSVIHIAGDEQRMVQFQLGMLEQMMGAQLAEEAMAFIRVGRGLIVNRDYIYSINLARQSIVMRDKRGKRNLELRASHEALKKLKELIESEC